MRINGPSKSSGIKGTKSASKAKGSGGFKLDGVAASDTASPMTATSSINNVDAILAIQEVEDVLTGRKKAIKRGFRMLDLLDDIKLGLLAGRVPKSQLERLVGVVGDRVEGDSDPELTKVLEEIELRARVELAKLGQYPSH